MKKQKNSKARRNGGQRSAGNYGAVLKGSSGVVTPGTSPSTYWMNPDSSYGSTFLGFTNVIPGIFGNRANQMAHMYKEFRILSLEVEIPPPQTGGQITQICGYTPNVGDLTTSLTYPNVMEYGSVVYAGATETVTRRLRVPRGVLSTGLSDWYMVEENPGTSSANPASDPNLSSHGLLFFLDSASAGYAYNLRWTIAFQGPEDPANVEPRMKIKLSSAEQALLDAYRRRDEKSDPNNALTTRS